MSNYNPYGNNKQNPFGQQQAPYAQQQHQQNQFQQPQQSMYGAQNPFAPQQLNMYQQPAAQSEKTMAPESFMDLNPFAPVPVAKKEAAPQQKNFFETNAQQIPTNPFPAMNQMQNQQQFQPQQQQNFFPPQQQQFVPQQQFQQPPQQFQPQQQQLQPQQQQFQMQPQQQQAQPTLFQLQPPSIPMAHSVATVPPALPQATSGEPEGKKEEVDLSWLFNFDEQTSLTDSDQEGKTPGLIEGISEVNSAVASSNCSSVNSEASEFSEADKIAAELQKLEPINARKAKNPTEYSILNPDKLQKVDTLMLADIMATQSLLDLAALPEVVSGFAQVKYLVNFLKREYNVKDLNSPTFFISHPEHGEHILFGTLSTMKTSNMDLLLKLHPIKKLAKEREIKQVVLLTEAPNAGEKLLLSHLQKEIGNDCQISYMKAVDKEFKVIRKEFSKQCVKLFDKVMYGSGGLKTIPGFDMFFARSWNKFMKHYHKAIGAAYLCGDLSGYLLLLANFWALTLHFKKENRCHDLSNVLCSHITRNVQQQIGSMVSKDTPSILLANINLLFKPEGLIHAFNQNGWKVELIKREDVVVHRTKSGGIPFVVNNKSSVTTGSLQHEIMKTGAHGKTVLSWSKRNQ